MLKYVLLLTVIWVAPIQARSDVYAFDNPQQEQRFKALTAELRCLVCQNQNIADSNADLAKDLRQQIYKMIQEKQSDQEILDFMVARYGDFVLYRPPFQATTVLLWVGPFLILVVALLVLFRVARSRHQIPAINQQQRDQMRKLLEGDGADQ